MADIGGFELARVAADAIDDRKGTEVILLDVSDILRIADVFVLATGNTRRQVQALADSVDEALRAYDRRPIRAEGRTEGEWALLDYGDLVVHLFQPEMREFYSLERLWGDAPRIGWEPNTPTVSAETAEIDAAVDARADAGRDDVGAGQPGAPGLERPPVEPG